ncbi:DUF1731 domain-containing protein [Parenemella sanctibonifatiensis]|uniref:Ketoreductase domain-containing protein n=1 Tax=Parenemella sanctibonifatiensis TaxID=2016505 RepID=A0A255EG54_9ACTN|nr:DUF1731 domain-containing protein [Parenemella sanctibonifatiensis]OYN90507.1 hypothetical protein CGZ92_01365 [Parenemella sanctibonifatiensis]
MAWQSTSSHVLAAPASLVWELAGDPRLLPEWHHWFADLLLDHDVPALGGRGEYVPNSPLRAMHQMVSQPFTVTRLDERVLEIRQLHPGGDHIMRWQIQDHPDGSELIQTMRISGRLPGPMIRMAGRPSAADFGLDAARLWGLLSTRPVTRNRIKAIIAGGSGSLGRRLAADLLTRGHAVVILTRQVDPELPFRQAVWDGQTVGPWAAELADPAACIVNLAGKLVDVRPTKKNIDELRDSRVNATRALVEASQQHPVRRWLQSSTTAIWADSGDTPLQEDSPVDATGLPQMTGVADAWERAVNGARTDHLSILRTSIVLAPDAPAYTRLAGLARGGIGRIGTGKQWFSWIHVEDWLAIARSILGVGPVDLPDGLVVAAAPEPARNADLMKQLRASLRDTGLGGRIALATPSAITKLGATAMGTDPALALTGRHATSTVLEQAGFQFQHPDLPSALEALAT